MSPQLMQVIYVLEDIGMIVGPGVGFLCQAFKIWKQGNSEGYSNFVSFILLIANISRIPFWIGKEEPVSYVVLIASLFMIVVQFIMIWVYICHLNHPSVSGSCEQEAQPQPNIQPFSDICKFSAYWKWRRIDIYIIHLLIYSSILTGLSLLLIPLTQTYVELLGAFSACTEATLAIPQAIKNCRRKSTAGLSKILVLCWFCGDAFKSYYYFYREFPLQLSICALLQLAVDVFIFLQFLYFDRYRRGRTKNRIATKRRSLKYERAEDSVEQQSSEGRSQGGKVKSFQRLVRQQ